MIVMITMTPARVKPDWFGLPALVRGAIESIAGSLAVHVINTGSGIVRRRRGIGENCVGIGRVRRVLDFVPIRLAGDRVLGNAAQVMLLRKRLETFRVLLVIRVIV